MAVIFEDFHVLDFTGMNVHVRGLPKSSNKLIVPVNPFDVKTLTQFTLPLQYIFSITIKISPVSNQSHFALLDSVIVKVT